MDSNEAKKVLMDSQIEKMHGTVVSIDTAPGRTVGIRGEDTAYALESIDPKTKTAKISIPASNSQTGLEVTREVPIQDLFLI